MRSSILFQSATVFAGTLAIIASFQILNNAYISEFGAHSDESAHVVTGMMVHDYLTNDKWSSPMQYAENYYLHYPKVALGHWPPVFYIVQAIWMTLFGVSAKSLLLMMASTTACLCTMIFLVSRNHLGSPYAILAAATFAVLPISSRLSSMVMTEMLVGLWSLAATFAFARYLESDGSIKWSLLFAVFSSLAILTKGTGLLLALVPPISILLSWRPHLLRRASFWAAACMVLIACAPFYLYTLKMQQNGMQHEHFTLSFVLESAFYYSKEMVIAITISVLLFFAIGLYVLVIYPLTIGSKPHPFFCALAALLVSTWIFHILVPCGLENRHLLPAIPPALIFMSAGIKWTAGKIKSQSFITSKNPEIILIALILLLTSSNAIEFGKNWTGFRNVVYCLREDEDRWGPVILVSSDPRGEGMMVAEAALNETHRPNRYILRASKMLAISRWSGSKYQNRFESIDNISSYFKDSSIGTIVFDSSLSPEESPEHHRQLEELLRSSPDKWQLAGRFDQVRNGQLYPQSILLYRSVNFKLSHPVNIHIDMNHMLGRTISEGNTPTKP